MASGSTSSTRRWRRRTCPPGPFTPARNFEAVRDVPNWKDVGPRFGVAYDLSGNGKTAVKASIGRYVVAEAYRIARPANPVNSSVNSMTRTWAAPAGVTTPAPSIRSTTAT